MKIASRVARIKPSATNAAAQVARELREAGRDIVSLTTGEPDFDTHEHVRRAAALAAERGQTRYTTVDGTAELKEAIREKFHRDNGLDYANDEIVVSTGGKQVIFNAFMATIEEGDEVIVPTPCWVSYPDIASLMGGRPVLVSCLGEPGLKLTPSLLEAAITDRTSWLVLNSPCNPSGAAYSAEELAGLAAVLLRHPHVNVMSDDMYERIIFDGGVHATIAAVEPRLKERVLTINGVSKTYAMTGWRIGYAGGPKSLMRAMAKLQSQSTSNPSSIGQAAALAALTGPQDYVAGWVLEYQKRRDLVLGRLGNIFDCPRPGGAFYLFPDCSRYFGRGQPDTGEPIRSSSDFSLYLLTAAGVATVSGEAFGSDAHFRMSLAVSNSDLVEACDRIAEAVANLI